MEVNDYELIYMIRQGDEAAFRMLADKFNDTVHYIIYKYMKKNHFGMDGQDYTQMALIKLLQAIDTYREDREASFSHFYFEILRHSMIDCYRLARSYGGICEFYSLSLDMFIEDGEGKYDIMNFIKAPHENSDFHAEVEHRIEESKEHLNPVERRIVDLRSIGYSYRQIAQELHIKQKKVDNTLRKVRIYKRSAR